MALINGGICKTQAPKCTQSTAAMAPLDTPHETITVDFLPTHTTLPKLKDQQSIKLLPIHLAEEPENPEKPHKLHIPDDNIRSDDSGQDTEEHTKFRATYEQDAQKFLLFIDYMVTRGNVSWLYREMNGVQIEWVSELKNSVADTSADTVRAVIRLSRQKLTSRERLYATLAHEFCHVCADLGLEVISDPRTEEQMHGPAWKKWVETSDEIMQPFGYYTKILVEADYEVDRKYHWECKTCGKRGMSDEPTGYQCTREGCSGTDPELIGISRISPSWKEDDRKSSELQQEDQAHARRDRSRKESLKTINSSAAASTDPQTPEPKTTRPVCPYAPEPCPPEEWCPVHSKSHDTVKRANRYEP